MSDENLNVENTTASNTSEAPKPNPVEGLMALKESNSKVFYGIVGGAGAIIVTLLALGLGGGDEVLKKAESKGIAAGQKYTLKSPNISIEGGETPTVRLVATPGAIAAFDDDENKTEECRKFPVGTNVTVLDKQEQSSVTYAKVQVDEGNCSGTIGWVLGINL